MQTESCPLPSGAQGGASSYHLTRRPGGEEHAHAPCPEAGRPRAPSACPALGSATDGIGSGASMYPAAPQAARPDLPRSPVPQGRDKYTRIPGVPADCSAVRRPSGQRSRDCSPRSRPLSRTHGRALAAHGPDLGSQLVLLESQAREPLTSCCPTWPCGEVRRRRDAPSRTLAAAPSWVPTGEAADLRLERAGLRLACGWSAGRDRGGPAEQPTAP